MTPILTTLTIIIAALGIVLVLLMFVRIRTLDAEARLKKHRSEKQGVADLLNYASVVDDGVIVGKNGAFMSAWLYQGEDVASSTEDQRELVSMRINQALARLGNGWMIHVDAVRRHATGYARPGASAFSDRVSAAIDRIGLASFSSHCNLAP